METPVEQRPYSDIATELERLFEAGLYRQAYDLGVRELGAPAEWAMPELRMQAARALGHLGLTRTSHYLIYKLWRLAPDTPRLKSRYASVTLRRRGPLEALRTLDALEAGGALTEQERLDLKLERVNIYNTYRDFGAAESVLAAIPEDQRDRWVGFAVAETHQAQDNYPAALAAIEQTLKEYPQFHSASLFKARSLQLNHDLAGATALLEEIWPQVESWWLGRALFDLYLEQRRYSEAEEVLHQLQRLPPWQDRNVKTQLKDMWADLLCAQKQYDKALPFLESKHLFHRQVAQSISNRTEGERRVLDVPFVRQRNMTCAPASMAAVSQYWGRAVSQETIIEAICYGGTQSFDERRWGNENGWLTREFDLTLPALRALIDRDVPVLLGTVEPGSAHLQIIVGYDLAMGTYLLRDPYHPRLQQMLIEDSHSYYASTGPRCLLLLPPEESARLNDVPLAHTDSYDTLHAVDLALQNNRRDEAEQAVQRAEAQAPGHRLTLECRRTLAYYDRDDQALLTVTEQLLQLFPDDVNLQLRKLSCLRELGSSGVALAYLESLAAQPDCHFLILSRLADRLRYDQRQAQRTARLLRQLLRQRPVHPQTLYAYAGVLWDERAYREACRLYRFVTCLEDTVDHYADSYFRAARYLKETDTGLAFLTERRDKFGRRSSGPAMSLYYALDSLERTEEALMVLARAVAERPEDGELLLFSAQKHLSAARPQRARDLVEQARGLCNPVRLHEVNAEIALYLLQKDEALAAYEQVLRIEPLNANANRAIMRIHAENDALELAIAHVDKQLERFPGNAMLQRLKYQWLDSSDTCAIAATLQSYVEHHPHDAWGYRCQSYILLAADHRAEAIAAAREAVAIDATDCSNHGALGDALLADRQLSAAREAFREAIKRSCDYGYAFDRLLAATHDPQEQRAEIAFIHAELLNQVSFGDGILDFASTASRWLEQDKLLEFLRFAVEARGDLWQSWLALAVAQRNKGDNSGSLATLETAATKFPMLPRLHFERGETLRTLHRNDDAVAALRQALELSPGWVNASNRLCELLERRGDLAGAIELQKKAIKHAPLVASPYGFLADLYLRSGDRQEAIANLEQAIARDPSYQWAWSTLYRLRKEDGEQASVLEQLQEQMRLSPYNVNLLQAFAALEEDKNQVITALTAYLERRPLHIELGEKLVQTLAESGDFENAFEWVGLQRWGAHPPLEIQTLEAWLYAKQHNYLRAIERMREVVQIYANHYEAWRLLAVWGEKTGHKKTVKKAVEQCVRLYPNDAGVLCFAAEKLQAVGGDWQRIGTLLQHAFELDVTDQYTALTFIDHLLDTNKNEEAGKALARLPQTDDVFVGLRKLRLAAQRQEKEHALDVFSTLLCDTINGGRVLRDAWKSLEQAGWQQAAAERLEDLYRQGTALHDQAGLYLAKHRLAALKPKAFARTLHDMSFDTGFEHRYLEGYLRHLCDKNHDIPWSIEEHLRRHWGKETYNLSLAGYLKYNVDHMEVAKWIFGEVEKRPDAEAWALYFASLCQRHADSWRHAERLIQRALAHNGGQYYEDISVWHSLDCLLNNEPVRLETLAHLTRRDLAPLTEYPLALVRALAELLHGDCTQVFPQLAPRLRDCQAIFQVFHRSPIAKAAQKRARAHVQSRLPKLPFYRRWFWLWRISNHF